MLDSAAFFQVETLSSVPVRCGVGSQHIRARACLASSKASRTAENQLVSHVADCLRTVTAARTRRAACVIDCPKSTAMKLLCWPLLLLCLGMAAVAAGQFTTLDVLPAYNEEDAEERRLVSELVVSLLGLPENHYLPPGRSAGTTSQYVRDLTKILERKATEKPEDTATKVEEDLEHLRKGERGAVFVAGEKTAGTRHMRGMAVAPVPTSVIRSLRHLILADFCSEETDCMQAL